MEESVIDYGDSPAGSVNANPSLPISHMQGDSTAPADTRPGDQYDRADVPMTESANDPTITAKEPSPRGAISDNPLDAPEAPRPHGEDDEDEREDEDMAGTGEVTKREDGSPEKTGAEGRASVGPGDGVADSQPTQTKASLESNARSHLIAQTHSIILPSYSTWFDMHTINNLEKKALPEFFNNRNRSKTPAVYKDYRDFMVNTYRLQPAEYLTVTACRRNLAGDVCAIMRVHAFLEQWGLINYQIDPDTRPSNIGPPFTGHFRITADTPRGLQPFQPAPNSSVTAGKPFAGTERGAAAAPASKADLNLEIRRNIYDQSGKDLTTTDTKDKQANGDGSVTNGASSAEVASGAKTIADLEKEPRKQFYCQSCAVDCTRVRWHLAKNIPNVAGSQGAKAKYDLCPNCFLEGHFPASSTALDFVKFEDTTYSAVPDRDASWNDAETLLLLEGLELFDDNWNSVADHVGTRTREDCVLKFLQLEIEDKYLETESGANGLSALSGRIPFNQADNPVMSVVGFLAGLSEPKAAAAAAGKTAEEMRQGLRDRLEKGVENESEETSRSKDKGKEKEAVKEEDTSMAIDSESSPQPHATNQLATTTPAPQSNPATNLATMALANTAGRAGMLATHEEREMTRLVSAAVNTTLQKFELKLEQFAEMEAVVQAERRELERGRQQLFLDRLAFKKRVKEVQELFRMASLSGATEGARMVQEVGAGLSGGERLGFGAGGVMERGDIKPLSVEGGAYKSYDV
ncbi:MAG: hypothetical protein M1812_003984 [Candelaria pacifica]|nr:MAG: hypothetical protein M1812_003984 [Candelaria pacifica]